MSEQFTRRGIIQLIIHQSEPAGRGTGAIVETPSWRGKLVYSSLISKKRTKKFQPMMHLPSSVTLTLCSRTLGYDLQKNAQNSYGVSHFFPTRLLEFSKSHLGMTLLMTAVAGSHSRRGRLHSLGCRLGRRLSYARLAAVFAA